jgi:hypothetical protein
MGGAVFTNASGKLIDGGYSITGVAVLDVVEGESVTKTLGHYLTSFRHGDRRSPSYEQVT